MKTLDTLNFPNNEEERSNSDHLKLSIFAKMETLDPLNTNNEDEKSNSRRIFPKNRNFKYFEH